MNHINDYFADLVFTEVDRKPEFGLVIYGVHVASGLGGGRKRYVLLSVPESSIHPPQGQRARISSLPWKSLQTRELEGSYRLRAQRWVMPRTGPDFLFEVTDRSDRETTYISPDLPGLEVSMLHSPRKKSRYQYHNRLMLKGMLDTFNCVIVSSALSDDIAPVQPSVPAPAPVQPSLSPAWAAYMAPAPAHAPVPAHAPAPGITSSDAETSLPALESFDVTGIDAGVAPDDAFELM